MRNKLHYLYFLFAAAFLLGSAAAAVYYRNLNKRQFVTKSNVRLYVDPDSPAAQQAAAWRGSRPADAASMDKLAAMPAAKWITGDADLSNLSGYYTAVRASGTTAVSVLYDIPGRDCRLYSSGGAADAKEYRLFVDAVARAIGTTSVIMVVEPDALAAVYTNDTAGRPCLSDNQRGERMELLRYAVNTLKTAPNARIYLDAGNSGWQEANSGMAARLDAAGIQNADGFSLNVSNFQTTADTIAYGDGLSRQLGGKHYIIDTSRNGLGPYDNTARPGYNWCNPPGRAMGHYPTADTGRGNLDAYLYIKVIGQSDGADPDTAKCFGGLEAGQWMPEYALGLIKRWPSELQPPRNYNAYGINR